MSHRLSYRWRSCNVIQTTVTYRFASEAIRVDISAETPDGNQNQGRVPQRTPKLAGDLVEQLVEAYLEGDSVYVLARRFGIHRQTVSAHLRRAGVEPREKRRYADNCGASTPSAARAVDRRSVR